ncbi:MAG: PEP-CTERM sorting domain-containing protein [Planctomycetota bacterium]
MKNKFSKTLLIAALAAAPAHADLSWTVTSSDANQSAVLYITTEGTSFTADGTYNLLSIDQVEYAFGLGNTPTALTGWGDMFGAAPPPFEQVLTGQVQVAGGTASIFEEFRASDPAGSNTARSGVAGSTSARTNGSSSDYDFIPTAVTLSPVSTVYNIGTVPPGSDFDVPGAVTGTQVGDGDTVRGEALISSSLLGGDTLGSFSQLNLFDGGTILRGFDAGPFDGTGSNIEVNITGGTVSSNFSARAGSTVNISGGIVREGFAASPGSTVNISGGSVGQLFGAFSRSVITISGGSIGGFFDARSGSTVNITGGTIGDGFDAQGGSTVNILGGSFGEQFEAQFNSTVNISGGSFGDGFDARSTSTVNLFGTSFVLDGEELTGLAFNEAFTITDRDVTLTGVLADGSAFEFDLNSVGSFSIDSIDSFNPGATLTVTLVPEPSSLALLGLGGLLVARRRREVRSLSFQSNENRIQ